MTLPNLKPIIYNFFSKRMSNSRAETVKKVGAIKANNYMYLQSIVTLIVAAIFLSEPVTLVGIIGIVLILGGLWLGDFLTRRKKMRQ